MSEFDYRPGVLADVLEKNDVEQAWKAHPGENRKLFGRSYNGFGIPESLRPLLDYIDLGDPEYMVMNRNDPLEFHRDHDLGTEVPASPGEHVSALAVYIDGGDVEGHRLVFPEEGREFALGHGDLLLFDSRLLHGNTPRTGGDGERTAILAYYHRVKL